MIVIPDIHGRTFWKSAVALAQPGEKIVFLGDYLDHYDGEVDAVSGETITSQSALLNFKDILRFKKENADRVVLLLGNHDTEYFLDTSACRQYFNYMMTIADLFTQNGDMFKLGYYCTINGQDFTFSHSCILEKWAKSVPELSECNTPQEVIDRISQLKGSQLTLALNKIGFDRYGHDAYGSMIWADVKEAIKCLCDDWLETVTFQVFGHSERKDGPIIREMFAMLDCHHAFRIREDCTDDNIPNWFEQI